MFRTSIIVAATIAAGVACTTQAEAVQATKFVAFQISCNSGTTCTKDVPLPAGTSGTYAMPGMTCSWAGANVTRVDIEIALKSNMARQFVIPQLLTAAESAAGFWHSMDNYNKVLLLSSLHRLRVTLYSDLPSQKIANCYAAF